MNTTRTTICTVSGTRSVMRSRREVARLAPGGRKRPGERDTRAARSRRADEAERWQDILDLLDPGKRCGAWSPAGAAGRPVVCTRAPHHAGEEHANAETGWCWHDEKP
jgi:hypothetical protein